MAEINPGAKIRSETKKTIDQIKKWLEIYEKNLAMYKKEKQEAEELEAQIVNLKRKLGGSPQVNPTRTQPNETESTLLSLSDLEGILKEAEEAKKIMDIEAHILEYGSEGLSTPRPSEKEVASAKAKLDTISKRLESEIDLKDINRANIDEASDKLRISKMIKELEDTIIKPDPEPDPEKVQLITQMKDALKTSLGISVLPEKFNPVRYDTLKEMSKYYADATKRIDQRILMYNSSIVEELQPEGKKVKAEIASIVLAGIKEAAEKAEKTGETSLPDKERGYREARQMHVADPEIEKEANKKIFSAFESGVGVTVEMRNEVYKPFDKFKEELPAKAEKARETLEARERSRQEAMTYAKDHPPGGPKISGVTSSTKRLSAEHQPSSQKSGKKR